MFRRGEESSMHVRSPEDQESYINNLGEEVAGIISRGATKKDIVKLNEYREYLIASARTEINNYREQGQPHDHALDNTMVDAKNSELVKIDRALEVLKLEQ